MKYSQILLVGFLALAGTIQSAAAESRDQAKQPRTLTITGTGEVKSPPDMAIVQLGVLRQAKTARAAVQANNEAMAQVISTVLSAGVAEKDAQTSGFSVQPRYTYYPNNKSQPQRPPEITGYTVSNNLAVIIRDLNIVGDVLDAVVTAGSNQINNISFSIQNPKPLRDEARRKAVSDAIDKAKLYAQAAGVTLGPILTISEQGSYSAPQPVYRQTMAAEAAYKSSPVPIAQGEQSLKMSVNIVWEIQ